MRRLIGYPPSRLAGQPLDAAAFPEYELGMHRTFILSAALLALSCAKTETPGTTPTANPTALRYDLQPGWTETLRNDGTRGIAVLTHLGTGVKIGVYLEQGSRRSAKDAADDFVSDVRINNPGSVGGVRGTSRDSIGEITVISNGGPSVAARCRAVMLQHGGRPMLAWFHIAAPYEHREVLIADFKRIAASARAEIR